MPAVKASRFVVLVAWCFVCGCGSEASVERPRSTFGAKQQEETIKQDRLRRQIAAAEERAAAARTRTNEATAGDSVAAGATAPTSASAGGGDRASFAALERSLGGRSGVALSDTGGTRSAGSWTTGVAWSSIKVPVAIAASRRGRADRDALTRAITASDNAAAERLWASLGPPPTAARAVGTVLRDGGDTTTQVQSARVRSGFTAFGQTPWPLVSAAAFAAHLPCLAGAAPVLTLMGQVVGGQRWGLGSAGVPARFKGGWGPTPSGRYEVRQLGVLTVRGRQVGVAIANAPADGSFATGTANLTRIAGWVVEHVRLSAPRSC